MEINVSALSLLQVFARLKALGQQAAWGAVWETYLPLFSAVLPVTEKVANRAIALRASSEERLPTIDSLIAATAALLDLTLIHRDPHLTAIPPHHVKQLLLPDK